MFKEDKPDCENYLKGSLQQIPKGKSTTSTFDEFTNQSTPIVIPRDLSMETTNSTTATTELYENSTTTSSSSGTTYNDGGIDQVLFKILVVLIGLVGMFANGFVATVLQMAYGGSKKEKVNVLMLNQMILDMYSCAMLTAVYAMKLVNVYFTSTLDYVLCVLFVSETPIWIGLNGSTANLVIIAVERYLMIVHPIWHKNHVKRWMIRAAVAFTWFDGVALNVPLFVITSNIQDGQCLVQRFWSTPQASYVYSIWYFFFYVLALVAFIYCYGRILAVVVRQAQAFKSAMETVGTTAANANAHRVKMNIIKTMITITSLFIVCWLPNTVFYFVVTVSPPLWTAMAYQLTLLLAFLNVCLNPFIYAGQYNIIRGRLTEIRVYVVSLTNRAAGQLMTHSSAVHPSTLIPSTSHQTGLATRVSHTTRDDANAQGMVNIDTAL